MLPSGAVGQAATDASGQPAGPPGEQAGEDDEDLDIQLEHEAEDALAQQGSEVELPISTCMHFPGALHAHIVDSVVGMHSPAGMGTTA